MELHDENPFKVRSLSIAIFNLRKVTSPLAKMPLTQLQELEGVGKSFAAAIDEINRAGRLDRLEKLRSLTPAGVAELAFIKGVGAKKAGMLWKELGTESAEQALAACQEGKVAAIKGLGEKTQQNIAEAITAYTRNKGRFLYAEAEPHVLNLVEAYQSTFPYKRISVSGDFRRVTEVVDYVDFVADNLSNSEATRFLTSMEGVSLDSASGPRLARGKFRSGLAFSIAWTDPDRFGSELTLRTGSPAHLSLSTPGGSLRQVAETKPFSTEEEVYRAAQLPILPPELREGLYEQEGISAGELITMESLRGCLHNHSTWSDGIHTLEEMARASIARGWEYFGVCDHSKAAVYANGMDEERVRAQWKEIDELNRKLAPFRILKGIEADILEDGSLDLGDDLLGQFDFVVVSIHSGLGMDEARATRRLIKAVSNPVTTMLGHPTGRILLERDGYPVDHTALLEACARNEVIVEINAHPSRLDLDWRWIRPALKAGVLISINPDAHEANGMDMMRYGVLTGRKAGLTTASTFNARSLPLVEAYLKARKKRKVHSSKPATH